MRKTSKDHSKCFIVWNFTLVELLIVIAIIAILAGMLLPAMNKAHQQGQKITCSSNLKQFGLGFTQYFSDSNDFLPGYNYEPSSSARANGTEYSHPWIYDVLDGAKTKRYIARSLRSCPVMGQSIIAGSKDYADFYMSTRVHYGMSYLFFTNCNRPGSVFRFSRVRTPSNKFFFADTYNSKPYSENTGRDSFNMNGSAGCVAPRHMLNVNILHADMHVAAVRANDKDDPHSAYPFKHDDSNSIKYLSPSGDYSTL